MNQKEIAKQIAAARKSGNKKEAQRLAGMMNAQTSAKKEQKRTGKMWI